MNPSTEKALAALVDASRRGTFGDSMLEVALALAAGGWPVFPCGLDKAPLVSGGFKSRSADVEQIKTWWETHPDALPAIVPGDCNLAAIDVDTPEAARAVDELGLFESGFIVASGGTSKPFDYNGTLRIGPHHTYVEAVEQPKIPGVVVRFRGGYVIAPGARRENKVYHVTDDGPPKQWGDVPAEVTRTPIEPGPDRAPSLERAAEIVRQLPNTEEVPRQMYVALAHAIKGACGDAGREMFLEWAARWPGNVNPAEDERVFDTIVKPGIGWKALWQYAEANGVDTRAERAADAAQDFSTPPTPRLTIVSPEDTRDKVQKMLMEVRDAPDGIGRALALMRLRKVGFTNSDVRGMMTELAPVESDEGYTLRELEASPELLELPTPAVPFLAWPGLKTILAGREKGGKSTLAMASCSAVSAGRDFLGVPTTAQRVLWLTEEALVLPYTRGKGMSADLDNFIVVGMGSNPQAQLKRAVKRWKPGVVVIDTLFRFAGIEDENDAAGWLPTILLLDEITQAGAALLILAHAQKSSAGGEYRGSSALGGFVDAILEMRKPQAGDTVRQISGRGRLHFGKPFGVRLLDEKTGEYEMLTDVGVALQQGLEGKLMRMIEKEPGQTGNDLADAVGGNRKATLDILRALKDAKKVTYAKEAGYRIPDPLAP